MGALFLARGPAFGDDDLGRKRRVQGSETSGGGNRASPLASASVPLGAVPDVMVNPAPAPASEVPVVANTEIYQLLSFLLCLEPRPSNATMTLDDWRRMGVISGRQKLPCARGRGVPSGAAPWAGLAAPLVNFFSRG